MSSLGFHLPLWVYQGSQQPLCEAKTMYSCQAHLYLEGKCGLAFAAQSDLMTTYATRSRRCCY